MQFGYVIVHVQDVAQTVDFYEKVFGLTRSLFTQAYAELATGGITLVFSSAQLENSEVPDGFIGYTKNSLALPAPGIHLSFLTPEVETSYQAAISAGATPLKAPQIKPWGQTIAFIRDLNGVVVTLASPPS